MTMTDLAIRPLAAPDLGPLWAIFETVIAEGETYVQDERTTRADFDVYWTGRGGEQWVAEHAGALVGGYTVRPNHPGRGDHVGTASYVVATSARGLGVGRALGEHSMARAAAIGFRALQFNFVVATNHAAVALWSRLGFATVGRLPGAFRHRHLGEVDALVMHRTVTG